MQGPERKPDDRQRAPHRPRGQDHRVLGSGPTLQGLALQVPRLNGRANTFPASKLAMPNKRGGNAMTVMTKTRLEVVPMTRHIGAELRGIDLREKPDDETVRAIYQAWLDHLVIVFPDQKLSQEDLVRATGFFGC